LRLQYDLRKSWREGGRRSRKRRRRSRRGRRGRGKSENLVRMGLVFGSELKAAALIPQVPSKKECLQTSICGM
jgi:hypothetical protein